MSMRRTGFTLIELLVVIAIIAILAAILFPVFARARAKAEQNACLSNLKQLGLAVRMYMSDHDERSPGNWNPSPMRTWAQAIYPYVKNDQIYVCPSDSNPCNVAAHGDFGPVNPDLRRNSYVWNSAWGPYICTATHGPSLGDADGQIDPSTICIMDTTGGHPNHNVCVQTAQSVGLTVDCAGGPVYDGVTPTGCVIGRHAEGFNAAHMGGHAKWYRLGSVPASLFSIGFD